MIEVIPNWHPLFVHFTIALLSMSALFFIGLKLVQNQSMRSQLIVLAYWNLWLGTGFAVVTVIAGWFAYNSVAHDAQSHAAMTEHRNWALITLATFIVATFWSVKGFNSKKNTGMPFIIFMFVAFLLLVSTGWHGSEAVYRYGLGVMSLPKVEGDGHEHEHTNNTGDTIKNESDGANKPGHESIDSQVNHVDDHSNHQHSH